jgi:hypothetical protein
MESIGFDILKIAKSEFGSNRKHRQNRFLTVTQYILDMANVIRNLRKNLSKEGRFIIIIGRQSKIRGVPFRNDLIIGMLGMMLGYKIALHQERKFKNQFGVEIYEDIIHFKRSETQIIANEKEIRKLAEYVLSKSTKNVEDETIKKDIILAINKIKEVSKSEILKKMKTPHLDKIKSALKNPKAKEDLKVLQDIMNEYLVWTKKMDSLKSKGDKKLEDLIKLLNEYKDNVEVKLILGSGSSFLTRQKGQLKLDNSIMEEFLIRLMDSNIIPELKGVEFITGPHKAFMSLAFRPQDFTNLGKKPEVIIKTKDNDFILGKKIHYKFSSESDFNSDKTHEGEFALAVIAAECKVNFDKTMFQECSGTAGRLKEGVPYAKYYTLVEFLDMAPEDCKLTDIDNVFLIRKAKRLPYEKRNNIEEVSKQRKSNPISYEVMLSFVNEIRNFLSSTWYNPNEALPRGSFN